MNWELTAIIVTWVILLWSALIILITFYVFTQASYLEQKYAKFNLEKELFGVVLGIAILGGYYFG